MLILRRIHCIHAAYGTVTLYESSWWPVGTQFEFSKKMNTNKWLQVESHRDVLDVTSLFSVEMSPGFEGSPRTRQGHSFTPEKTSVFYAVTLRRQLD